MADTPTPREGEIIFYTTPEGVTKVEVVFQDETFWLTLNRIADLFSTSKQDISYHLQQIYDSGELIREATVKEVLTVQSEGDRNVSRKLDYYNLDAIIAVGYRVNSLQATQFRIWATQTLREFIIKGFVLDDERLKLNKRFGPDYFDELLERIREIRASERRFYLQNKLHWAITGKTAAEIVADRAKASQPNMGLTTWKNAPKGKIFKSDVAIAKNYLTEKEIKSLERIVTMYLDYAENQAERAIPMHMQDWVQKLDAFLEFNEYDILHNPGKVSHEVATRLAQEEYDHFRIEQDRNYLSDFENEANRIVKGKK